MIKNTDGVLTKYFYSGSTSFLNGTQFTGAIADMNTGLYYMNADKLRV